MKSNNNPPPLTEDERAIIERIRAQMFENFALRGAAAKAAEAARRGKRS